MKKLLLIILFVVLSYEAVAGGRTYVRGHFRKDGAYVSPHYRTSPDGSFYNNWSTYGNINPYTGEYGKKLFPDSYTPRGYIKSKIPDLYLAPVPNEIERTKNNTILPYVLSYKNTELTIPEDVDKLIEKDSQKKWPNDFSIQAYTIKNQREGYLRLVGQKKSFSEIGIPDNIFKWCLDTSQKQWPNDYSMQAYTFENNLEGYLKLSALITSEEWKCLPENVSSAILKQSYDSWSNDFSMQAYTVEKQIDGFYELVRLEENLKNIPEPITVEIKNRARKSWPNDLGMQAYTIKNEFEGYLRLKSLKIK